MDASEIRAKRRNEKEVLTPMTGETIMFPIADGTVKLCGRDQRQRTSTLMRDRPDRGEERGNLQGESDWSSSAPLQDSSLCDGEARNDFWSISGNSIYPRHVEPRVELYVPRQISFLVPLKYIDVTRATSTSLDVMLEENIDGFWKVRCRTSLFVLTWVGGCKTNLRVEMSTRCQMYRPVDRWNGRFCLSLNLGRTV